MRSFFINYQKFSYGDQNTLAFINEQFTYLAFWWYELGAEMKSAMYYNTWGVMLCWDFWSINAGILIHFMHNFVGGKILQCKFWKCEPIIGNSILHTHNLYSFSKTICFLKHNPNIVTFLWYIFSTSQKISPRHTYSTDIPILDHYYWVTTFYHYFMWNYQSDYC